MTADLATDVGGMQLANPVLVASGCFASGAEIDRFYDVTELGAIICKSVTLEPREGLPTPRMAETPSGMLNAIGLQNPGIDRWLAKDLPWLADRGAAVVASIAGTSVDEYRQLARKLRGANGVVGIEVNISCPNVEDRGTVFACRADPAGAAIDAVVRESSVPVFAKLTADVTDIVEIATAVIRAGAAGVSLINTVLGMAIDIDTGRPKLANVVGGLSGPAIRPIAVRAVHQVHQAMPQVPIIGMGGIGGAEDALEFVYAGATAIAVGTGNFVNPFAALDVCRGLGAWLDARGLAGLSELRGTVKLP